jgi:surfactin synthase thioesterase subunit
MDDGVQLFGLRSGDRILDYHSEDLPTITRLYADEIESIIPSGRLFLGGNCQGGMMMRHIVLELANRGRDIGLVILMEQSRFSPVSIPVLLLFGERSYLNPYAQMKNPDQLFRLAYAGGYHLEMIPGGHSEYFLPENIGGLALAIRRHLLPHQERQAS